MIIYKQELQAKKKRQLELPHFGQGPKFTLTLSTANRIPLESSNSPTTTKCGALGMTLNCN